MARIIRLLHRSSVLFASAWVGLFVAAMAWAIATPLGGSPDEPAHIIRAASVVRGELIGEATEESAVRQVQVPVGLASAPGWACYAFDGTATPLCIDDIPEGMALKAAETTSGLYNPAFYLLVGWPSLVFEDASVAVFGMRAVGALIVTCLLAVGITALHRLWPNRTTAFGVAAAVTPMVLFLASAVNPNGLEVAAGFAFLSALLLLVGPEPVPRRWPWLVAAGVAGVLLAQARGISPLWMLVVVIIVIVMTPWPRVRRELRRSGTIVVVAVVAVGVVLSVGWTLATGTLARMGEFPGATDTPRRAFFLMVTRAFDPGLIGYFGWLDAPAPAFAYALWSFLSFAIVVVAFAVGRARDRWAVGVAATALLILPAVVQAVSIRSSGYVWQGRYALVAYVFLIAIATVVVGEHTARRRTPIGVSRRATWTVATLVVVGHAWALLAALQRYQGGLALDQVVLNPIWVPPGGIVLWILVVAAGVALTSFALVVASTQTAPAAGDDADLEDSTTSPVR